MAHTFRTIVLVLALTAILSGVAVGAVPAQGTQGSGVRSIRLVRDLPPRQPLPVDQQALVDWAVDRFAQAGLELPKLTVRFDPSRALCGHAEGRYHHEAHGERVVTICAPDNGTFAAELQARRTLLHEFGHAWDFANLSAAARRDLAPLLGVDEWNEDHDHWEDRGVERFAETFVFALLDQPRRVLKVDLDCSSLLGAFRTATGADPLGPGLPSCAA